MRAEKKLSRTLDDEALRDLAREERRVKTRSKEGLSAAQAEDFKLKKRITEAAREFEEFVERYEFSLGPQVRETTGWSAVTYKDNFVLCAARTIVESNIERLVFSKLAELGLDVTIETNCEV